MLIIRDKQMDAFQRQRVEEFIVRMIGHVKAEFPARYEALTKDGVRTFIERTIEDGRALRITTAGAIATLIELRLDFGEQFERAPDRNKARKILAHPSLPDHVRLEVIREMFEAQTEGRRVTPFVPPVEAGGQS